MKKLIVLLADGFEEIEALAVADIFRRLGVDVTLAGITSGKVTGAHNMSVDADALLENTDTSSADALFLPGGMPGSVNLLNDARTLETVKSFYSSGRIVSAICAAPIVLAAAGMIPGHRFTMYPGFETFLNGAVPENSAAEIDRNVVTGRGPGAVFAFAGALAKSLGLADECAELYKAMFVEL